MRYLKFETGEWIETYLFNDADWFYFCVENKLNAENLSYITACGYVITFGTHFRVQLYNKVVKKM